MNDVENNILEVYLVGGCVRDKQLGLPVHDQDWVVVGSRPEVLLQKGFKPVGKDFPVFLHPTTHQEYALARTERKKHAGYHGFECNTDPSITLEEDLLRRDLTINAMAEDRHGRLIDPFHGAQDLEHKILRHVSPAFSEDPVRILRVARFSAQFPNFSVHPDTIHLMRVMVHNGEVNSLVPERVWKELERALRTRAPWKFFEVLKLCNAHEILFPKIHMVHMEDLLNHSDELCDSRFRLSLIFYRSEIQDFVDFKKKYKIPNQYTQIIDLIHRIKQNFIFLNIQKSEEILKFFILGDAFRRKDRFLNCIKILDIFLEKNKKFLFFEKILSKIEKINTTDLQNKKLDNKRFADEIFKLRIKEIDQIIQHDS